MQVTVACEYHLLPPVCWEDSEQMTLSLSVGDRVVHVETKIGIGDDGPELRALVVKSNAELDPESAVRLAGSRTLEECPEPIRDAADRHGRSASKILRWLKVETRDAELDTNAVARSIIEVLDEQGLPLKRWFDWPMVRFRDLRPSTGAKELRAAAGRCEAGEEPPLALYLLLQAIASYLGFDYRLSTLHSGLALEAGLYLFLVNELKSQESPGDPADERVRKDRLRQKKPILERLEKATFGELLSIAEEQKLDEKLEEGMLKRIGKIVKERRDKIVHPRGLLGVEVQRTEAKEARSLAERFLKLTGQLDIPRPL